MVLHDVADDAKLVEVAPAALGAEGLLEGDGDVGNGVAVPDGLEGDVGKPTERLWTSIRSTSHFCA